MADLSTLASKSTPFTGDHTTVVANFEGQLFHATDTKTIYISESPTGDLEPYGGGTGGSGGGGMTLIQEVITVANQQSIDFTSIPNTYTHLKILIKEGTHFNVNSQAIFVYFNGDTTLGNYNCLINTFNGSGNTHNFFQGIPVGFSSGNGGQSTGGVDTSIGDILFYKDTNHRKMLTSQNNYLGTGTLEEQKITLTWTNQAAITDIQLDLSGTLTFDAGSVFQLWGY